MAGWPHRKVTAPFLRRAGVWRVVVCTRPSYVRCFTTDAEADAYAAARGADWVQTIVVDTRERRGRAFTVTSPWQPATYRGTCWLCQRLIHPGETIGNVTYGPSPADPRPQGGWAHHHCAELEWRHVGHPPGAELPHLTPTPDPEPSGRGR